jgi:hypothetical protein
MVRLTQAAPRQVPSHRLFWVAPAAKKALGGACTAHPCLQSCGVSGGWDHQRRQAHQVKEELIRN